MHESRTSHIRNALGDNMAKLLMLMALTTGLTLTAGEITGTVLNQDGRTVNNAKVLVFSELSSVFVRQTRADRNGFYSFDLYPGPYRIVVFKAGFEPEVARFLVIHEADQIALEHELISKRNGNRKVAERLKDLIRNGSRDPFRDLSGPETAVAATLLPAPDDSLVGRVETSARQGYGGDFESVSAVEVRTRITDRLAFASELISGIAPETDVTTVQIRAGMEMKLARAALKVTAESIQDPSTTREGSSEQIAIGGSYGENHRAETEVQLTRSVEGPEEQRELSVDQRFGYMLGKHRLEHEAEVTGWDHNGTTYAKRAHMETQWRAGEHAPIGVVGEVTYLSVPEDRQTASKLWLAADYQRIMGYFDIRSKVGLAEDDHDRNFVQNHTVSAQLGAVTVQSIYREDSEHRAYAGSDLFGDYLVRPLTPYSNESFYRNQIREIAFETRLDHGHGWDSSLTWRRSATRADLLYNRGELAFREASEVQHQRLGYRLESAGLGAHIELAHSQNERRAEHFDATELIYGQTLWPFTSRGMMFNLELRMKHNPAVPAWWLLEEGPWLQGTEGLFYEGRLSLQF